MRRRILFQHPELQELYYDLVAKGLASIEDAIAVGVKIELKDIEDIAMKLEETDKGEIIHVYTNLLDGSYSGCQKIVPLFERFILQALIPSLPYCGIYF